MFYWSCWNGITTVNKTRSFNQQTREHRDRWRSPSSDRQPITEQHHESQHRPLIGRRLADRWRLTGGVLLAAGHKHAQSQSCWNKIQLLIGCSSEPHPSPHSLFEASGSFSWCTTRDEEAQEAGYKHEWTGSEVSQSQREHHETDQIDDRKTHISDITDAQMFLKFKKTINIQIINVKLNICGRQGCNKIVIPTVSVRCLQYTAVHTQVSGNCVFIFRRASTLVLK